MLRALDRARAAADTLVLFTSDHGDFIGAHGLYDKQGPWEDAIRVPFLLRFPDVLPPGASDLLIDSPDLLPTLCGLAGVAAPGGVQGRNLASYLRTGTVPDDDSALLAAYCNFGNWPRIAARPGVAPLYAAREYRGLRTRTHTYVEDRSGPWLLYDNEADPCQMRNLAAEPAARALRDDLAARLRRRREALGDDFRPGPEYVREWGYEVDASGTIPCPGWVG